MVHLKREPNLGGFGPEGSSRCAKRGRGISSFLQPATASLVPATWQPFPLAPHPTCWASSGCTCAFCDDTGSPMSDNAICWELRLCACAISMIEACLALSLRCSDQTSSSCRTSGSSAAEFMPYRGRLNYHCQVKEAQSLTTYDDAFRVTT